MTAPTLHGPTLQAIAHALGGRVSGNQVLAPTPGHSRHDRGTAIRLAANAPDGVLVACYNGGTADALAVKDALRAAGLLPERTGPRRQLSPAERATLAKAEARRAAEQQAAQALAAHHCRNMLAQANRADPAHPYLARKGIGAERLWQSGDMLLVPMHDGTGTVCNLQRIWPDGSKRFCKGARVNGLCWFAGRLTDRLVIGEGMATLAAIRRATGLPVVAAMTAGNLPTVAAAIHARRPELHLILAADDDPAGIEAARRAAALTGGTIAFPKVTQA